jgi:hypothetical protein
MAFLDNSGDIILDAVLTDTGRYRLAKGDGSFRVVKFALGDDEINYSLYDKNNTSGSAYYDLSILQTPILEAFTDNAASLKSKLITFSRNNLLYLPIIKINESINGYERVNIGDSAGSFLIAVDEVTERALDVTGHLTGLIKAATGQATSKIRLDQGIDNNAVSPALDLDDDLVETQYIIEIDNRFGKIASVNGTIAATSYIDDDQIASYFFSLGSDVEFISTNTVTTAVGNGQVIAGPRGTTIEFTIRSTLELSLQNDTFLFDQLGGETQLTATDSSLVDVKFIDSTIRVMGATTGYKVDIPVRFVKKK